MVTKKTPAELDVDIRFLLANDRTLLAWIRTSLAVLAGGLILMQVHKGQQLIGLSVLIAGTVVALIGYSRYRAADRAIRAGRLPHSGKGPAFEVGLVVFLAIALGAAELILTN
jgi:putative membrane protein